MNASEQVQTPRVIIDEVETSHERKIGDEEEARCDNESIDSHTLFAKEVGVTVDYERQISLMNKAIHEEIGFGMFQVKLIILAGFGWLADNIWFEILSMSLTLVNKEWNLSSQNTAKWATFSLYVGLLIGSLFWGFFSDIIGRRPSWNITLFISAAFGIAVGGSNNFTTFCVLLGCLGLGLGGNLPVDGAMLIEYIPGPQQWILTFLSLFWCLGQLYAALIGWAFITNFHCEDVLSENGAPCPRADNWGWRYSWFLLGGSVMVMWIIRFFVYPIPESPKFLLGIGREEQAYEVILYIAKENKRTTSLTFEQLKNAKYGRIEKINNDNTERRSEEVAKKEPEASVEVREPLRINRLGNWSDSLWVPGQFRQSWKKVKIAPIAALFASRKMALNTILISLCWGLIGLGYPLYNSFIATYLKDIGNTSDGTSSLSEQYQQLVVFAVCAIPGSFIAAGTVELKYIGRRLTMAFFTCLTGLFLFLFTTARSSAAVWGWNCATSLTENAMYAVLYAITYEVFPAPQRGTGDGFAMSVQRTFGIVSTLVAIYTPDGQFKPPIYVSASTFIVASFIMIFLPYEPRGKVAI
ncbi:Similar to S.cerevisiae protein PHO84 (High-affinity inorganic phosphate (Pi) transporter) [Malassezia sympodialis ATCC 42132]|uniref:Similar to S.cerevisiae protein PHO84 (High-affinity inorganic phosphate (Pi) transporter) n=1 Tax=Malassezia sympodialis (strain ATCC 42132) TaxID=1230383 RepID=A0A1M8A222_MALS4|nr:Similar to S.cerevisiae protein PHO84 (High-affinity inorganic phosphate (Pi) transporter) [Malassezia sympodialis ATCC 42132]